MPPRRLQPAGRDYNLPGDQYASRQVSDFNGLAGRNVLRRDANSQEKTP
jgi:hypothetical protein